MVRVKVRVLLGLDGLPDALLVLVVQVIESAERAGVVDLVQDLRERAGDENVSEGYNVRQSFDGSSQFW